MRPVQGNVQPRSVKVDFDKIGHLDTVRTSIYKMPVHEKKSLKFALKGVKASRVELIVDGLLISVLKPEYPDDWTADTKTPLDFLGGKNFHRGLVDVPVEIVITTNDTNLPDIMIGIVTPSKTWQLNEEHFQEAVTVSSDSGPKSMVLIYHRSGCGFAPE